MSSRQTLPRIWLMTDRRIGKALWDCIERVPERGGVVLRHHRSDAAFGERVAQACHARDLMLAVAGDVAYARRLGAAMVHNPDGDGDGLLTSRAVHDRDEAAAAQGADLVFVSPVHASASHRGGAAIGLEAALDLAALAQVPAIALGGMDPARGAQAMAAGFYGWAGIDAWLNSERLRS